jgi:hypothetical protein
MIRHQNWPTPLLLVAVGALALLASSCGDGGSDYTSPPTAVVTPPPSTLPPSSGGSGSSGCALGEGDEDAVCERTAPTMMHFIDAAIDAIVAEQPELFDLTIESGPTTRQYLVLDKEAYLDGDVYLSDGYIRRGGASYRESCIPAKFPLPRPDDAPPQGSGCGRPFPPPVSRFNVKVHFQGGDFWTLNSTPLVGHDVEYCEKIGYTDGRSLCPVRPEGHPERVACEEWAVGRAEDTGRVGPTWRLDEQLCTGPESGCQNAADNQYLLWAYGSGRYSACAENGACGYLDVNRAGY